jgi:CheY-like chemotaxis protein
MVFVVVGHSERLQTSTQPGNRHLMLVCLCLCLQDVMMPDVDGLDILRYVRSNAQLADLPVISE